MKILSASIATLMIFGSVLPVHADNDRNRNDDGGGQVSNTNTNTSTNNNTNTNTNENNNTNNNKNTNKNNNTNNNNSSSSSTGGSSNSSSVSSGGNSSASSTGGNSTQKQSLSNSNKVGAITNTLVNQGTVYYPDWINVNPSQSSVSMSSASCQGPTLNGAIQTLETNPWNNEYGVQGSIGISIPLNVQKDCFEIQASIRKRTTFENAANMAMMCGQLEKMNVKLDDVRFPELSACLSPVTPVKK